MFEDYNDELFHPIEGHLAWDVKLILFITPKTQEKIPTQDLIQDLDKKLKQNCTWFGKILF